MKRILLFVVALLFSAMALAAVNINTATKEELEALPGIGPVKAQAIIDYRKANGPFKTTEDVMKVSGIKEGEYGKLKGLISVSGSTTVPAAPMKAEARRPRPLRLPAPAAPPMKAEASKAAAPAAPPPQAEASKAAAPTAAAPAAKAEPAKTAAPAAPAMTEKEKAAAEKKAAEGSEGREGQGRQGREGSQGEGRQGREGSEGQSREG